MKTVDRLCVAVGVGLAVWGGLVCYDTRREAEWRARSYNDEAEYHIVVQHEGAHGLPLLASGLGLAGLGLTGPSTRRPSTDTSAT